MDIQRKLQSILGPGTVPANRSHNVPGLPEAGSQSFLDALAKTTRGLSEDGQRQTSQPVSLGTAAAAAVIGDTPDDRATLLHQLPSGPANEENEVEATIPFRDHEPPTADPMPTRPSSLRFLPPIGVLWAPSSYRGSGVVGLGVDGTPAATAESLRLKTAHYLEPERHGIVLNSEGLLFRDAVAKGYVTADEAGLGTLLALLDKGSIGADARPAEITNYFDNFFASWSR